MAKRKNSLQPLLDIIPKPFRNKYFMVILFFITWMTFFDKHDFYTQYKLKQSLNKLKEDKAYYEKMIKVSKADKKDIEENIEKFAREHYIMQKDDEDVFIFVEE